MGFSPENAASQMYFSNYVINDPGDGGLILCDKQLGICELVSSASAETRTLQDPTKPAIQLVLRMLTDGGGDIIVYSSCGFDRQLEQYATFADAGDMLSLISVCITPVTFRWEPFNGNLGVTIA